MMGNWKLGLTMLFYGEWTMMYIKLISMWRSRKCYKKLWKAGCKPRGARWCGPEMVDYFIKWGLMKIRRED